MSALLFYDLFNLNFKLLCKSLNLTNVLFLLYMCVCDAEEISVMEGDSVTLNTGRTEMDYNEIYWNFGHTNVLIARISVKKDMSEVYDYVLDGRFRDRLKLDHQTGSLIITNTRHEHSGVYYLNIDTIKLYNLTVYGKFHYYSFKDDLYLIIYLLFYS